METGTLAPTPEQSLSIHDITVDAFQVLRDEQDAKIIAAENEAKANLSNESRNAKGARDAVVQARESVKAGFDGMAEDFAARYADKEQDAQTYNMLVLMARTVSVDKMTNGKWRLGDKDENNRHSNPNTSGKTLVSNTLDQMKNEAGPAPDTPDRPASMLETAAKEQMNDSYNKLAELRTQLAEARLKLRQSMRKGGKNKETTEKYEALLAQYNDQVNDYLLKSGAFFNAQGLTGDTAVSATLDTFKKLQTEYDDTERKLLTRNDRRIDKFAQWLAKPKRLGAASAGAGAGSGLIARLLANKVVKPVAHGALLGLGVAAPAVLVASWGVRSLKELLLAPVKNRADAIVHFDKRAKEDEASITSQWQQVINAVNQGNGDVLDALHTHGRSLHRDVINQRLEADMSSNRKRVIAAAAIGGGVAIAAEVLTSAPLQPLWNRLGSTLSSLGLANVPGFGWLQKPPVPAAHVPMAVEKRVTLRPKHLAHAKEHVAGFNQNANVEVGHGYTQELQDLAEQKGIHLSGAQAWEAYQHMNDQLHGNFMHTPNGVNASYRMADGNWGIRPVGHTEWNAAALRNFNQWLHENEETKNAMAERAKKLGKAAYTKAA